MNAILAALAIASTTSAPQASSPPAQGPDARRMQVIWDAFDGRMNTQTDVWFDDGEFPRVIQGLRIMFTLHPTDFEIATNLGWMLENIEEWDQAVAIYEKYRKDNPKDPDAHYPLANYYAMKRQFDKVPPILEPTIAMTPKPHANSYRRLAQAYERLDKLKDSKRVWEAYLKLMPNDDAAKNNLRRVESKLAGK